MLLLGQYGKVCKQLGHLLPCTTPTVCARGVDACHVLPKKDAVCSCVTLAGHAEHRTCISVWLGRELAAACVRRAATQRRQRRCAAPWRPQAPAAGPSAVPAAVGAPAAWRAQQVRLATTLAGRSACQLLFACPRRGEQHAQQPRPARVIAYVVHSQLCSAPLHARQQA